MLGGFIAGWPTRRGPDEDRQRPLRRAGRQRRPRATFLLEIALIGWSSPAPGCCSSPARCARGARAADEKLEAEGAELEALKEAKYREIRDAELDYKTGKLSEADWRSLDRKLRAEAVELLKRLDQID